MTVFSVQSKLGHTVSCEKNLLRLCVFQ